MIMHHTVIYKGGSHQPAKMIAHALEMLLC